MIEQNNANLLISSAQNPRVKLSVALRNRRDRDREQLFLIEGYRELLRAYDNHYPVQTLFICPEIFIGNNEMALIGKFKNAGTEIIATTSIIMKKMTYRERPDGLLGIAPQKHHSLNSLILPANPLLLIAVAIEKPGNLGTILRSADATGVHGVIICDHCTDLFNPNVVRASTGTLFTVPCIEASSVTTLNWLHTQDIRTLAATPHTELIYTDIEMTGGLAVVVGCEQVGLPDEWLNRANLRVRIPMLGKADSLNVATATTILLYEAARQRRFQ